MTIRRPFFKAGSSKDNNLLIVILADQTDERGPVLKTLPLTLKHARKHALKNTKYQHTSVIILSDDGNIVDLVKYEPTFTSDNFSINANDLQQLKDILKLFKNSSGIKELPEGPQVFDRELIVGNMDRLSFEASEALKNMNLYHLKANSFIRIQICNFGARKIQDVNEIEYGNFVQEIVPVSCQLSIPGNYSIISDKDTRAIDLEINSKDFHRYKSHFKQLLNENKSIEEIAESISDFIDRNNINANNIQLISNNQSIPINCRSSLFLPGNESSC